MMDSLQGEHIRTAGVIIRGAMTREEHLLIIGVITKQYQLIRVLLDLLKNKQTISDDDLKAFEFVAMQDDAATLALIRQVKSFYVRAAKEVGLDTGLESS